MLTARGRAALNPAIDARALAVADLPAYCGWTFVERSGAMTPLLRRPSTGDDMGRLNGKVAIITVERRHRRRDRGAVLQRAYSASPASTPTRQRWARAAAGRALRATQCTAVRVHVQYNSTLRFIYCTGCVHLDRNVQALVAFYSSKWAMSSDLYLGLRASLHHQSLPQETRSQERATMSKSTSAGNTTASGLAARWINLKVKTKILLGFALVLTLFATVSAMSYRSLVKIGEAFDGYSRAADIVSTVLGADVAFSELRRHAREFAVTGDEAEATAVATAEKNVKRAIASGLETSRDPERRKLLQHMQGELEAYVKDFGRVATMKREQGKLIHDVLDPAGLKMREDLEAVMTKAAQAGNSDAEKLGQAAQAAVMQMRLYANILIGRHEQTAADRVEKFYGDLVKSMQALDGVSKGASFRSDFEDLQKLSGQYYGTYGRISALGHELEKLVNGTMKKEAETIAADVKAIVDSGAADEHRIQDETEALIVSTEVLVLALSLGGLALGFGLAWLIGAAIARPVLALTAVMGRLANRDWAVEVPSLGQRDEIGQMADAVQVFKRNGVENDRLQAEQAKEQEAKERRQKAVEGYIAKFETSVAAALKTLASASTELRTTAEAMSATAEETSRQSTAVAAASEQATSNVQTVATAGEELSSSISEIGRQVSNSSRIAGKAVEEAGKTDVKVQGLVESAQKIGDVVSLINDIAAQTNLLALNATIEAARAGEAGKGFAVVAAEVKSLANQTAKATEEIGQQIGSIQGATKESVDAIKSISRTISEMNEIATAIASAVEEQGAATQEIARNVQQAAKGTQDVSSNIANVNQAAAETGAAASQVLTASGEMAKEAETLRQEVDRFLADIRAA
jgi:methyl-accepting chemotaxis protein